MAKDKDEQRLPNPQDPQTPQDYDPTHDKEFPHDVADIEDADESGGEKIRYEDDLRDEEGRPVGMRRPGEFILPDDENVDGEWTLPTRPGGGWDKALDKSLEEQIDEPVSEDETNPQ